MSNISVEKNFKVSANDLWSIVSKFNKMHEILPDMITSCEVNWNHSEEGAPATRVCGTADGTINEILLSKDDAARVLRYSIENGSPLPVSNYIGQAEILEQIDGSTTFRWSATFEPVGMKEDEVVGMLRQVFTQVLDGYVNLL